MRSGYAREVDDWYVEPSWVVDALVGAIGERLTGTVIWDPACGMGTIPDRLMALGFDASGSDSVDRAGGRFYEFDFFLERDAVRSLPKNTFIVTNPPYARDLVEPFVRLALRLAMGVAVILPISWLASRSRHALFTVDPPAEVLILSARPSMPPGRMLGVPGFAAFKGGTVDYCWIVWDRRDAGQPTHLRWIDKPEEATDGR